jgi:hypothetical protein
MGVSTTCCGRSRYSSGMLAPCVSDAAACHAHALRLALAYTIVY